MKNETRARGLAGVAALVSGVMLIGTSGLTLVVGWALWAAGLAVLLVSIPASGGGDQPPPRGPESSASPQRYSLVP